MTHAKRPSIGVIVRLESFGFVLIVVVGSLLHFTYEVSGERCWVGVFSAMNESVWEHLKLAFWPAVAWTLFQRCLMPNSSPNFWLAKVLALLLMPALIAVAALAFAVLSFFLQSFRSATLLLSTRRLGSCVDQLNPQPFSAPTASLV